MTDLKQLTRRARHVLAGLRGGALRWDPRGRRVSPALVVASRLPVMELDDRQQLIDEYMTGLNKTLEDRPHGWSGDPAASGDLAEAVRSVLWYHTIELPGGITTPGTYDQRPLVPHYRIPEKLDGQRALDIGTWDGFWAFELERRGARVTAVDLDKLSDVDLPHAIREAVDRAGLDQRFGGGFELARSALGSSVERVVRSIYDLDPADIGTFDLVHIGEVLQHVECPSKALRSVRSVTSGTLIVSGRFDRDLPNGAMLYRGGWTNGTWWTYSLSALGQMIVDAGFCDVRIVSAYQISSAWAGPGAWSAVFHARSS